MLRVTLSRFFGYHVYKSLTGVAETGYVVFTPRTVTDDVKDVWRRAVGGEIVLKKREAG